MPWPRHDQHFSTKHINSFIPQVFADWFLNAAMVLVPEHVYILERGGDKREKATNVKCIGRHMAARSF